MFRVDLDVPYEFKDLAKKHKAKWDPEKKKWYVLDPSSSQVVALGMFLPERYRNELIALAEQVANKMRYTNTKKKWENKSSSSPRITTSCATGVDSASPHHPATPEFHDFIDANDVPF